MSTIKGRETVWDLYNKGWVYCGGNKDEADMHTWLHFKRRLGIDEDYQPKSKSKCPCGTKIQYQAYIYNINDKGNIVIKVVGQSCIKRFYNAEYLDARKTCRKLCPVCNIVHSNAKRTKLCSRCCIDYCLDCGGSKGDKKYARCYRCYYKKYYN
tara:strand:- start:1072 stop:1533 length:462 start_codon:yes stop_codon:yes gene_type:complete